MDPASGASPVHGLLFTLTVSSPSVWPHCLGNHPFRGFLEVKRIGTETQRGSRAFENNIIVEVPAQFQVLFEDLSHLDHP